jgi:hypothetical protein
MMIILVVVGTITHLCDCTASLCEYECVKQYGHFIIGHWQEKPAPGTFNSCMAYSTLQLAQFRLYTFLVLLVFNVY